MERDWNSWDDKPRTIEEHIEVYRENLVKPKEPEVVNEVENLDLFEVSSMIRFRMLSRCHITNIFQDMAPKIVKQKKVYLNQGRNEQPSFSRLEATVSAEIPITVKSHIIKEVFFFLNSINFSHSRMSLKTGTKTISKLDGTRSMTRTRSN